MSSRQFYEEGTEFPLIAVSYMASWQREAFFCDEGAKETQGESALIWCDAGLTLEDPEGRGHPDVSRPRRTFNVNMVGQFITWVSAK